METKGAEVKTTRLRWEGEEEGVGGTGSGGKGGGRRGEGEGGGEGRWGKRRDEGGGEGGWGEGKVTESQVCIRKSQIRSIKNTISITAETIA